MGVYEERGAMHWIPPALIKASPPSSPELKKLEVTFAVKEERENYTAQDEGGSNNDSAAAELPIPPALIKDSPPSSPELKKLEVTFAVKEERENYTAQDEGGSNNDSAAAELPILPALIKASPPSSPELKKLEVTFAVKEERENYTAQDEGGSNNDSAAAELPIPPALIKDSPPSSPELKKLEVTFAVKEERENYTAQDEGGSNNDSAAAELPIPPALIKDSPLSSPELKKLEVTFAVKEERENYTAQDEGGSNNDSAAAELPIPPALIKASPPSSPELKKLEVTFAVKEERENYTAQDEGGSNNDSAAAELPIPPALIKASPPSSPELKKLEVTFAVKEERENYTAQDEGGSNNDSAAAELPQQSERYISSAYEGGGDLSPVAPATSPGSPRDCTSCRKREPPDEPQQQPADEACAGCGNRITDRFYLLALERRWHTPCLRCCECKMPLDSERRCYARDSNIFCKNDYLRLYGAKPCARCNTPISASELVMRARDLVFHVHCFSCALCNTPLTKGDTFGIRDSAVYCRLHYETMSEYGPHIPLQAPPQMCPGPYPGPPPGPHYPPYPSPEFARVDAEVPKGPPYFNGAAAPPPRQKGRPRKKKPKDQDLMPANLDLNPEYLEMGFRGGAGLGSTSRTKRMRTSFKHHQLRTMKSYFAINHNPDAKDLKQLSQKTGLPKRVLQVWFQNARAKWRRMVTKQENKMAEKCSPDASLEMDMYHGPMGSIQSLPPHSPPYSVMGGPPSPNSMDCP